LKSYSCTHTPTLLSLKQRLWPLASTPRGLYSTGLMHRAHTYTHMNTAHPYVYLRPICTYLKAKQVFGFHTAYTQQAYTQQVWCTSAQPAHTKHIILCISHTLHHTYTPQVWCTSAYPAHTKHMYIAHPAPHLYPTGVVHQCIPCTPCTHIKHKYTYTLHTLHHTHPQQVWCTSVYNAHPVHT
jgi:hypothetical protein